MLMRSLSKLLATSKASRCALPFAAALVGFGCSHPLEVTNLHMYQARVELGAPSDYRPVVAIAPFSGAPDDLWYHNALLERLDMHSGFLDVRSSYTKSRFSKSEYDPDIILDIRPRVTYRSSGWNFLVNFPGFLIFAPAWHGYNYRADIMTNVLIKDGDGRVLEQLQIPVSYDIRQGDPDRVVLAQLSWLEVGVIALVSGVYVANEFDRDIIHLLQTRVGANYTRYVLADAQRQTRGLAESLQRAEVAAPPGEESDDPTSNVGDETPRD